MRLISGLPIIVSTFAGTGTIEGGIDEAYCFAIPLTEEDVRLYYNGLSAQAEVGPITVEENLAAAEAEAKWLAEQELVVTLTQQSHKLC